MIGKRNNEIITKIDKKPTNGINIICLILNYFAQGNDRLPSSLVYSTHEYD